MKKHHIAGWRSLVLAFILTWALAGCGGGSSTSESAPTLPSINVTSNITSAATWTHGNVYVVQNSISTSATLTIEPGTIVKFKQGTSISVNAGGTIIADGQSASTPIIFTSLNDDTYGGDTNDNGAATVPVRGDWAYVKVTTSGSVFNHCVFAYGGIAAPYTGTLSLQNNSVVTVTNCTFANNKGGSLTDYRAAALNASDTVAGTVIRGNIFYGNDLPLVVNGLYDMDGTNVFHKNVGGATITNTYNGIFWDGVYAQMGNITWLNTEVPFVTNSPIAIPAGSTLTLGDGVVVKFDAGERIDVSGALISNASTSIVFTSLKDDRVGGDTNGDGSATSPAPGDWLGIWVSANGSIFNKTRFSYGGSSPYQATLLVGSVGGNTATITDCIFSHNKGGTPLDTRGAALDLGQAAPGTIITGNTFYDNDMPLVINGLVDIDGSNVFHVVSNGTTTVTNKYNGIFTDHPTVYGTVTWSNTEVPYVMYNTVLGIGNSMGNLQPAGELVLGNDVVLKFGGGTGRIDIYNSGTLTQGTGNYFTSFNDDSLLGDTNGDGLSAGAYGDWVGINICHGLCTWATGSNILYATY